MQFTSEEIASLSTEERLDLIAQLWDSLDEAHPKLTTPQRAELDRRLATLDNDRAEGVSWEILRADLEQRCP